MREKIVFGFFLLFLIFSSSSIFAVDSSNYGLKISATWSESQNYIKVDITNVNANLNSAYDVYASCTSGFSQFGNALRISGLDIGSSQAVYLPITGTTTSGMQDGICIVTVKDINNPNNFDTKSVSVSVSAIVICTEGDQRISSQDIQKCVNNVWKTISTCQPGTHPDFVSGNIECVKGENGETGNTIFYGVIFLLIILLIAGDILFKKFKISVKKMKGSGKIFKKN